MTLTLKYYKEKTPHHAQAFTWYFLVAYCIKLLALLISLIEKK